MNDYNFSLRLPRDLHDWLTIDATANERSVSQHIRFIVNQYRERKWMEAQRQAIAEQGGTDETGND